MFANVFKFPQTFQCDSLDYFIELVARTVTCKVNSRISGIMDSRPMPSTQTPQCNCIYFTTLNSMLTLLTSTLTCMYTLDCQCTSSISAVVNINHGEGKARRVLEHGRCEVTYITNNSQVMKILAEVTEGRRTDLEEETATRWCDDLLSWNTSSGHSCNGSDHSSEYTESEITNVSSDETDTPDQSEETFTLTSAESTSAEAYSEGTTYSSEPYDELTHRLILLMLVKLLMCTTNKTRKWLPRADLIRIIKNLTDKMLAEIRCADVVIGPDPKTVHKIGKALFGNLCRLFGSAEALQEVLESQDTADNALIIRALKTCLTVPAPKKNVFVRFFSSVGCFGLNSL
ncbi:hypothetical protein KUCAC02_003256 [Chaenocephalus aceratus]|uniref:Uncharacterized protein n=1 Tax=Chaenocephalus aceratus TaxID=36190 RepID=A0ACB9WLS6_CHAAC|nr:hypothetical protein KUCAC02_003256 [Chaenocephalus aceratus]